MGRGVAQTLREMRSSSDSRWTGHSVTQTRVEREFTQNHL